jgi:outer membrane immunogenic protein
MKIPVLVGFGFAALVVSPVMAADMGVKAPVLKAPPAVFSWTGCYLGGHFGSFFGEENWTGAAASIQDPTDLVVGGQVGCNYQVSNWVLGVQGDYAYTNASDTAVDQVLTNLTDRSKINSLASVTGRIGYAVDHWLPYVKAGGAWTHDKYDTFVTGTYAPFSAASETLGGWTVGTGIEYAITSNVSMFFEYDWYDFGTRTNSFAVVGGGPSLSVDIKERDSVVKVGLNWTFR